ncbi:hypothetical protein EVAR_30001_1 [Eumeta japonica]|uniref:Uncharacterized protein n=1 Tax=Eumeta variegata TaxID=151549 RepID=A0A4C1VTD1_EUMVA|nr:hypothetical protein EVAR_30001_1 [Eumeta japonica]
MRSTHPKYRTPTDRKCELTASSVPFRPTSRSYLRDLQRTDDSSGLRASIVGGDALRSALSPPLENVIQKAYELKLSLQS